MTAAKVKPSTLSSLVYNSGGRRFVTTLLVLATTSVLAWYGKIVGDAYAITVVGTVGAFIAGVSYQKVKTVEK